jgi:hypothetical protein
MGDDPSWISDKQALGLCQDSLQQNGYTNTEITGELAATERCTFSFSTNGTNAPVRLVVDRKSRKVRYENSRP